MKSKYVKPELIMENFSLCQSIASGCDGHGASATMGAPLYASKDVCAWDVGGLAVFSNDVFACFIKVGPNDSYNNYCYDNPNGGITIFTS